MSRWLALGGDLLFAADWLGVLLRTLLGLTVIWAFLVPIMSWVERRASAFMQDRLGPNRVGPLGLFQIVADGIKFLMKEDVVPAGAQRALFVAAPIAAVLVAFLAVAVVPFGYRLGPQGGQSLIIADLDAGLLFLLAVSSLSVYALLLGGWAANNKYALLGAVRAGAQMVSYEIPLRPRRPGGHAARRQRAPPRHRAAQSRWWYVFPGFLGFVLYLTSSYAETNRLPFDLPEGESEIVGYHAEYSSMKFALFFHRRVRQHGDPVAGRGLPLLRRPPVPPAFSPGNRWGSTCASPGRCLPLVLGQGLFLPLPLRLGALDPAPLPLRPADAARLEAADPPRPGQPRRLDPLSLLAGALTWPASSTPFFPG